MTDKPMNLKELIANNICGHCIADACPDGSFCYQVLCVEGNLQADSILSLFSSYIKSVEMSDEEIEKLPKWITDIRLTDVKTIIKSYQSKLLKGMDGKE